MNNTKEKVKNLRIDAYDYHLPDENIAKYPLEQRDTSKLLVYRGGEISETHFAQLPQLIDEGSLLIFNNTRVIPARVLFRKSTGAQIEIFCLEPHQPSDYQMCLQSRECVWKCIVGNLKKWKEGDLYKSLLIHGKKVELKASKVSDESSHQYIRFSWDDASFTFSEVIENAGLTPIPPYLNRSSEEIDRERYQTVYSKVEGSVAAPTAGLHFTSAVLDEMSSRGVRLSEVTLHVGAGTFKPVKSETIEGHDMHTEFFSVSLDTLLDLQNHAGQIVSVGTTSLRTLESLYWLGVKLHKKHVFTGNLPHVTQWDAYELDGKLSYAEAIAELVAYLKAQDKTQFYATTQIIIAPGYEIKSIKALVTNFHQPKSTLLLLVSAITGERWTDIYKYALENEFRFLSYGDSSVLFV